MVTLTLLVLLNNILNFSETVHRYHCAYYSHKSQQPNEYKFFAMVLVTQGEQHEKKDTLKISLRQLIAWIANQNCFHVKKHCQRIVLTTNNPFWLSFVLHRRHTFYRSYIFNIPFFVNFLWQKHAKSFHLNTLFAFFSLFLELSTWILRIKQWLSCNNIGFYFYFPFCRETNKSLIGMLHIIFPLVYMMVYDGALFHWIISFYQQNK